jgi:hypothetical protein
VVDERLHHEQGDDERDRDHHRLERKSSKPAPTDLEDGHRRNQCDKPTPGV